MALKPSRPIGLRWKVTGLIVIPMLLVLAVSTSIGYARQRQTSLANMSLLASQTGQVIEQALVRDMLVSDFDHIQSTVDSIAEDDRVRTLYLLDTQGNVIFAPGRDGVGLQLSNENPTCQPCHRHPPEQRPSGVVVNLENGQPVFRSMHPIENRPACARCHNPNEPLIGLLLTDLSIEPVESAIARELRDSLLWLAGTVITTTFLSSYAVNRWVLQRLGKLTTAMEDIGLRGLADRLPTAPADEIGRLSTAFNAMADRVEQRNRQNVALSEALERRSEERGTLLRRLLKAQEEERIKVARELHDDLGQTLSSTALNIELGQRALSQQQDLESAIEHLKLANEQIADATDHMYDLILGLRPSVLDDLGLIAALRTLGQRILEPVGVGFAVETAGLRQRLPASIETALFRIFQEAMTNILKHARAQDVRISVLVDDGWVEGRIEDDGRGFDPEETGSRSENGGLGLLGIRERASQLGGRLRIDSHPSKGTAITVRLPVEGGERD